MIRPPDLEGNRRHRVVASEPGLQELLEDVYDRSFVSADQRTYLRRGGGTGRGTVAKWALDGRRALSHGEVLGRVARAMSGVLQEQGLQQVAGCGYGSFLLVGALVGGNPSLRGALVRDSRKAYGFRQQVEGDLTSEASVAIVDDVVNSGNSALKAAVDLRCAGYTPVAVVPVFVYAWRDTAARLSRERLSLHPLAELYPANDRLSTPRV